MVTIRDIALKAGVSVATVSRVFNNPAIVREETREKVMEIARSLNFEPDPLARSLSTGKLGVVALVVPNITSPNFSYIARGCQERLMADGVTLGLYDTGEDLASELEILRSIDRRRADGVIVASRSAIHGQESLDLMELSIPVVLIERSPEGLPLDAVCIDNREAARLACNHLLDLGHRNVAIISSYLDTLAGSERLSGFQEAMELAGLPLPDRNIFEGDFTMEGGREAAQVILARDDPPTAVFASSDEMAYGLIDELRLAGWQVPGKISVVGCEDLPMSKVFVPHLTTVRTPKLRLGYKAAELILTRIEDAGRPPRVCHLPVELIIRESTRTRIE